MNILSMDKVPGAIGPYPQGYEVNEVICTPGQISVNPVDGTAAEGIATQAEQSCKNVRATLKAVGTGFDRVFKTTCFLTGMNDSGMFNKVYVKYLVSRPARSCVTVKTLPRGVLCEVEAIAVK